MSTPQDFTVLISVYSGDRSDLFRAALQSIADNSLAPTKVLIVVDGPVRTDLDEVISQFEGDFRTFQVLRLPENRGLAAALNAGLERVETRYVIRADADDWNERDRFAALMAKLSEGYDLVGSAIVEVNEDGTAYASRVPPLTTEDIRAFARRRNPFNHMSVAYRVAPVRACGGYPDFTFREDYALWCLLLQGGVRSCNLDTPLVRATAGLGMIRRRGGKEYAFGEYRFQQYLVEIGFKGKTEAILDGLARLTVFLLPPFFRRLVYSKFLRS